MNSHDIALSRPMACAAQLAAHAADAHRFIDKRVLLTGELALLTTENGKFILLDSLHLLVRFCRFVDIWLPPSLEGLQQKAVSLAKSVEFTEAVNFLTDMPDYTLYNAILSVGATARTDLPWTTVNSNGWLARVSSMERGLDHTCEQSNPIGALAAASLGVSEVFKRLLVLKPERGPFFDNLRFSCYTFEVNTDDPGPLLPETISLPETLVPGQGAIGNGITLLLTQLRCAGSVMLLDRQKYGPENLGTCVLLGVDGVDSPKADWNATHFFPAHDLGAVPIVEALEDVLPKFGSKYPYPSVVLNGFDNVPARRDVQDLWPDIMIDGAIGDFACQVVTHVWGSGTACLKCLFTETPASDPALVASQETGLSPERVRQAESLVTDHDVDQASLEQREKLRAHVGRKICSVVSEAVIAKTSAREDSTNFSPSVPFVATMSSVMVVATLVKYLCGDSQNLSARFYFDILQGPQQGEHLREKPKMTCDCQFRRPLLEKWRRERSGSVASDV